MKSFCPQHQQLLIPNPKLPGEFMPIHGGVEFGKVGACTECKAEYHRLSDENGELKRKLDMAYAKIQELRPDPQIPLAEAKPNKKAHMSRKGAGVQK